MFSGVFNIFNMNSGRDYMMKETNSYQLERNGDKLLLGRILSVFDSGFNRLSFGGMDISPMERVMVPTKREG